MRRVGEFTGEVLAREMKIFVHIQSPFGTIGHIVDDAVIGDKLPGTALPRIAA